MTDVRALLLEAADRGTSRSRLTELGNDAEESVRLTALSNPSFDIRELAMWVGDPDAGTSEVALDAVIARPRELQYVVWDEPRLVDLLRMRLTDKENSEYVISDQVFKSLMTGWNSAVAATIAFDITDRTSIIELYIDVDPTEGE